MKSTPALPPRAFPARALPAPGLLGRGPALAAAAAILAWTLARPGPEGFFSTPFIFLPAAAFALLVLHWLAGERDFRLVAGHLRALEAGNRDRETLLRATRRIASRTTAGGVYRSTLAGLRPLLPYRKGLALIARGPGGEWSPGPRRRVSPAEALDIARIFRQPGFLDCSPSRSAAETLVREIPGPLRPSADDGRWNNPCLVFLPGGRARVPVACLLLDREPGARGANPSLVDELARFAGAAAARGRAFEEVSRLSKLDPMTGFFNHRHFCEMAARETAQALERGDSFAVMLSDIDDFKSHVDARGHLAADETLRQLGALVGRSVYPGDIVGRWGGDEFAYLLPGATIPRARETAGRVQASVSDFFAAPGPGSGRLTISFGAALFEGPGDDWTRALARADRALFAAKENGKNRLCFWEDLET